MTSSGRQKEKHRRVDVGTNSLTKYHEDDDVKDDKDVIECENNTVTIAEN